MTTRLANSSSLEQRGVIRFLLAESVKSCEILSRMQRQYVPSCMSRANFYKWVQAFKDGRESITNDLRSGRPVDVSTPEAVQAVEDLIKSDRRITLDEIAKLLQNWTSPMAQCMQLCVRSCIFQKSAVTGFPRC